MPAASASLGRQLTLAAPFALGALLALYVGLGIHSQASHFSDKPLPQFLMEDYGYYAAGFERFRAGQSPYADHVIGTAFLYPPQSLLVVGAFQALTPLPLRFAVYATLSLLSLLAIVLLVLRGCGIALGDRRSWVAFVLALGFAPVGWCLYLGQINLFVALSIAAGFFLAARRPVAAGAAIAVGAAIKLTPVLLLVVFLQRRYLRVHIAFLVTSLVLVLVTGVVFGFGQFTTYLTVARQLEHSFPVGLNGSLSFMNTLFLAAGVAHVSTDGWLAAAQLAYSAALGGLLLLAAWWTRAGQDRQLFYGAVALALTALPNVLWYHHMVFALAGLLTLLFSREAPRLLRIGAGATFAIIQLDRVLSPKLDKFTTTPALLALLALTLVTLARHRGRVAKPSSVRERAW